MIVCVCNNVSDRQIRNAVDAGMCSMRDLRQHLLIGTDCGKCHPCAKQVLRESSQKVTQLSRLHALALPV